MIEFTAFYNPNDFNKKHNINCVNRFNITIFRHIFGEQMNNEEYANCYDFPHYYELAFSFRNIIHEVDVIEKTFAEFSRAKGKNFLELGCGPSFHMLELSKKGYHYSGLDLNEAMLSYSSLKASKASIKADFIKSSMIDFQLPDKMDYIFIALGSIYANSTKEVEQLFKSAANALKSGGLFLLDWCVQFDPIQLFNTEGQSWEVSQDNIKIHTSVVMKQTNKVEQLFEEQLEMKVCDGTHTQILKSYSTKRAIYPQEFLLFLKNNNQFEFIGWWNNWDLDKPMLTNDSPIFRPIILLRKVNE